MRPTIILVHGAFAESSSWDGVIDQLLGCGLSGAAFRSARLRLATRKAAHAQTPCGLVFDRKK